MKLSNEWWNDSRNNQIDGKRRLINGESAAYSAEPASSHLSSLTIAYCVAF